MRIGLATTPVCADLDQAVGTALYYIARAASFDVEIVCFPAAFLPGLRARSFSIPLCEDADLHSALEKIRSGAAASGVGVIMPMEWPAPSGRLNLAMVISPKGEVLGSQAKIQLEPEEEGIYVAGQGRHVFEMCGTVFGVVICEEGWKYPETVRWAARRGARVVFHPHCTGHNASRRSTRQWCDPDGPFFEKAMVCRSVENGIYFASVNYALSCQESATSVIGPDGSCLAHQPYGEEGLLILALEPDAADRNAARRYAPERY